MTYAAMFPCRLPYRAKILIFDVLGRLNSPTYRARVRNEAEGTIIAVRPHVAAVGAFVFVHPITLHWHENTSGRDDRASQDVCDKPVHIDLMDHSEFSPVRTLSDSSFNLIFLKRQELCNILNKMLILSNTQKI